MHGGYLDLQSEVGVGTTVTVRFPAERIIGLPLAKSLVEMHGGYLDLQSKVGVGTTVTVRFPAERIVHLPRDVQTLGVAEGKAG